MAIYRIKRNNSIQIILIILLMIVLAIIFSPIKTKIVTATEDYIVEEEQVREVSFDTIEEHAVNISVTNKTIQSVEMNYTLQFEGEPYRTTSGSNKFANQDLILVLEQDVTFCVQYKYVFFNGDIEVNDDEGEVCFDDSHIKDFTIQELYVGDIDDHHYEVEITKLPKIKKEVVSTYNVPKLENVTVTTYENITELVNVTKTKNVNKTIRTWMFG